MFYLRLVLLPHQLVRGVASGRRWAEHKIKQERWGIPSPLLFNFMFRCLHRLVDHTADGVRRLPFHPLGRVGIGVQGEARAVVAQGIREGFHVHAVLQRQGCERMSRV